MPQFRNVTIPAFLTVEFLQGMKTRVVDKVNKDFDCTYLCHLIAWYMPGFSSEYYANEARIEFEYFLSAIGIHNDGSGFVGCNLPEWWRDYAQAYNLDNLNRVSFLNMLIKAVK